MIAEAEIRRFAARWQVDPMVVDLDYSLGWFLAAFRSGREANLRLRFKGGTCLRKCYFADYRFSEALAKNCENRQMTIVLQPSMWYHITYKCAIPLRNQ